MVCIRIDCRNLNCKVINKEGKEEVMLLRLNKWKITNGIMLAFIILALWSVGMYWIFSICQENDRNFVARQIKSCEVSGYSSYIVKGNEVTCLD